MKKYLLKLFVILFVTQTLHAVEPARPGEKGDKAQEEKPILLETKKPAVQSEKPVFTGTKPSHVEKPGSQAAKPAVAHKAEVFALPDSLKPAVNFWKKIYSHYDSHQVVFYDTGNPNAIYGVLDLPRVPNEISSPKYREQVQKKFQSISDDIALLTGSERPKKLDAHLQQLADSIDKNGLKDVADLNKRLRAQSGLRSQFAMGLKMSGRYVDEVKAVLIAQGLPTELVALVFVESLWNLNASSHAGASGPWGMVEETARRFIHVNKFTDERLDPIVATVGAAEFLKKVKDGLGEWPLAITAYNYGYSGMLRAVAGLETKNIDVIIEKHQSPIFGYASKNYYTEFLAALDVYSNREKYFPGLTTERPWDYELVQILRPVSVGDLLASGALSKNELLSFNPGLTKYTVNNQEVIPQEYSLRVPKGKSKHFYDRLKTVPNPKREEAKWKISTKYHAKGKESIDLIARKYGIIADFLSNKLGKPLSYKPTGVINIRSHTYGFSQLKKIAENIVAALTPNRAAPATTP